MTVSARLRSPKNPPPVAVITTYCLPSLPWNVMGAECAPAELETIADLPLLAPALERRGYSSADVDAIMSGNWLRILRRTLPLGVTPP